MLIIPRHSGQAQTAGCATETTVLNCGRGASASSSRQRGTSWARNCASALAAAEPSKKRLA